MKTLILTAALLGGTAFAAHAHDYALGDLSIGHPFAFATAPNAPVAGGYLVVTNSGATDDTLIAVRVDDAVSGMVQLHEMTLSGGVMRMSELEGGIPVPAGETVRLEQGGLHVMFLQLRQGFEAGQSIPATLVFERAGEVSVVFDVEARGAGHGGHGHGHSD